MTALGTENTLSESDVRAAFTQAQEQHKDFLLIQLYAAPGAMPIGAGVAPSSGVLDLFEEAVPVTREQLFDAMCDLQDRYGVANIVRAYSLSREFDDARLGTHLEDFFMLDCISYIQKELDNERNSVRQAAYNYAYALRNRAEGLLGGIVGRFRPA